MYFRTRQDFYRSRQWERFRQVVIQERQTEDGETICEYCGKPIVKPYDLVIHHKIELDDTNYNDVTVSLNPANVEIVHFRCHNLIHERFSQGQRPTYRYKPHQVFLVYGPPCGGKSTWVRENAGPDDLVVDMDALWEAVSTQDRLHKPDRLKGTVFDLRDWMYDRVKHRSGRWVNAFVISGSPGVSERERLRGLLGVTDTVFIDTPQDTCMERCLSRCTDADGKIDLDVLEKQRQYISDWFQKFQPEKCAD